MQSSTSGKRFDRRSAGGGLPRSNKLNTGSSFVAKRDAKERKHYQERVLREEECIEEVQ